MDDQGAAGLTITTVALCLSMFDRCLPPAHTVADRPPTPEYVAQVQGTCMRAAPVAIGLGVGASMLARTPWPAVGSLVVCAWLWWQYDSAAKVGTLPEVTTGGRLGRYGR